MTILVTGGAGYIGSHAVLALRDAGERVIVLDNLSTGLKSALPEDVLLVIGDVGDSSLVNSVIGDHRIKAIIHFAGSTSVSESIADPLKYYRNNTANSRTLIDCAVKSGVEQFIFSSTAAVYGNPASIPVGEDQPVAPVSPYGWSKAMTEVMLRDASRVYPMRHVILRYFNVAGADPKVRIGQSTDSATHLIKVALETALGRRSKLTVFGSDYPTPDGTCIRDFIHVSDLANAHCKALAYLHRRQPSITLNCGYGRGFSVLEVVAAVKRAAKVDFPIELGGRRPGDIVAVVSASEMARDILDWSFCYDSLDAIVTHALAWERKILDAEAAIDCAMKASEGSVGRLA